jgi:hypothetical protein
MGRGRLGRQYPGQRGLNATGRGVRAVASMVACCVLLATPAAARAADPKPVNPDAEFLEFLGSSDDVDADLQDYLAEPAEPQARKPQTAPKLGSAGT